MDSLMGGLVPSCFALAARDEPRDPPGGACGLILPRSEVGRPLHHIKARPRAQWPRPDGRLVPASPEATPVLPQRRHESAAVPRGACTRRSTTHGRALQAPLQSAAP
jgi:hypothetical protein